MSNLQDFLEMKKYYLGIIKDKDQRIAELEQRLAELKQTYNKANEKLKNITEELENNFVHGQELNDLREEKDKLIYELEKELAKYKELQDQLGLKNADEFEWFVMLDLLTDNEKNMHILDLHRELAKIKENAIMPKFKVGQECYYVYTKSQLRPFNVKIGRITFDTDRKNKIMYDSDFEDDDSYFEKYCGMKECDLFPTEQEAQAKLQELRGGE